MLFLKQGLSCLLLLTFLLLLSYPTHTMASSGSSDLKPQDEFEFSSSPSVSRRKPSQLDGSSVSSSTSQRNKINIVKVLYCVS